MAEWRLLAAVPAGRPCRCGGRRFASLGDGRLGFGPSSGWAGHGDGLVPAWFSNGLRVCCCRTGSGLPRNLRRHRRREPASRDIDIAELGQEIRRRRPAAGLLGQALLDQRAELGGDTVEVRSAVHDAVDQRGRGASAERAMPGGGVAEHRSEAEHIARRPDLAAFGLLGGHEPGRADHQPGVGQHARLRGHGDAEVDHAGPVVGQQNVRRLEVAVHHASRMDGSQAFRQSRCQRQHRGCGERPVIFHSVGQRRAGDVGSSEPRHRAVQVRINQQRCEQATDLACRLDLAPEPGPELAVGSQVGPDHLNRDWPPAG